MRQLKALLWKNFLFYKVHYFFAAAMYIFPLFMMFSGLGPAMARNPFIPGCEFKTVVLPPSHPSFTMNSFACNDRTVCHQSCKNCNSGEMFENFLQPDRVCRSSGNFCPDITDIVPGVPFKRINANYLINRGILFYYPKNNETDKLINAMDQIMNPNNLFGSPENETEPHKREPPAVEELANCFKPLSKRTVSFSDRQTTWRTFGYYLDSYKQWTRITKLQLPWAFIDFESVGPDFRYKLYLEREITDKSVLFLQSLVEAAAVKTLTGRPPAYQLAIKRFPRRCHKDPNVGKSIKIAFCLMVGVGFIFVVDVLTREMCQEKVSQLLDFLFIAGVPGWKVTLSWFLFGAPKLVVLALLFGLLIKWVMPDYLGDTDSSVIMSIMLLYGLSVFFLSVACAKRIPHVQGASSAAFMLLILGYLLPYYGNYTESVGYIGARAMLGKIASFLFPSMSASMAFFYIVDAEVSGVGITWTNLGYSPAAEDSYGGAKEAMMYQVISLLVLIALSVDYQSIRKWRKKKSNELVTKYSKKESETPPVVEEVPDGAQKEVGIQIIDLVKSFGDMHAVSHLSIDFYKSQITAFLGHNGAGKSTTMNILTGMMSLTNGSVHINGKDIEDPQERTHIRKTLGFCPQHDVIYQEMTPAQHLRFYGDLKGIDKEEVAIFAENIFTQMKMNDPQQQKTLAKDLSGGMKRKLSIAIAFLGDPTVLILDEPTSAIDPFSRRAIWDVILKSRATSTILLSTHYMQEADLLGDRIAIIDKGKLKCCGSPMFLKSKFGTGFFLKMAHQQAINLEEMEQRLNQIVTATLVTKSETETTFSVPLEAVRSSEMVSAFKYLEDNTDELGLSSFGIAESTMEQVFFNVVSEAVAHGAKGVIPEMTDHKDHPLLKIAKETEHESDLLKMQVSAVWKKRFLLTKRSKEALILQVIMPFVFVGIMFFVSRLIQSGEQKKQDGFFLEPKIPNVDNPLMFYSGPDNKFAQTLVSYGLGTKCLKHHDYPTQNGNCKIYNDKHLPVAIVANVTNHACKCQKCPDMATDPQPNTVVIASNETLLNLRFRNITDFLIKTNKHGFIGGIEEIFIPPTAYTNLSWQFDNITDYPVKFHLLWSLVSKIGQTQVNLENSLINTYSNILLRSGVPTTADNYYLTGNAATDPGYYGITATLFRTTLTEDDYNFGSMVLPFVLGILLSLVVTYPLASIAELLINERKQGIKGLQFAAGLDRVVYWMGNFAFDYSFFTILAVLVAILFTLFPTESLNSIGIFVIMMMFAAGLLLQSYWFTWIENPAVSKMILFNLGTLFACVPLVLTIGRSFSWYNTVNLALCVIPHYFITESFLTMDLNRRKQFPYAVFSWSVLGQRIFMSMVSCILLAAMIHLCESGFFAAYSDKKAMKAVEVEKSEGDRDVAAEEHLIAETPIEELNKTNSLVVKNIVKYFPKNKLVAVGDVSFGVRKGECFGLLGMNGAGKSTLFKMLTGSLTPTKGKALLMGYDVQYEPSKITEHMGYCPQEDLLFKKMTPEEHLDYYGKIRGIPHDLRQELIHHLIKAIGLQPHIGKLTENLSGGNKRKLNFAISLIRFPDVIFLDEMTTGLDPEARRGAWDVLMLALSQGSSAVITSHSMEECEALCNRLVIMVNGQFKCIGGVQYLKDKHGNKYTVKLRLNPSSDKSILLAKIKEEFPDTELVEEQTRFVEIVIPRQNMKLSKLFHLIHGLKDHGMEDFSVSQTTLEHVFVNMVKEQL